MRTIVAGLRALRDAPLAIAPFAAEGVLGGILVLTGGFPGDGAAAASVGVFPLDVFFDVKQALAHGRGWPWFCAAVAFSVVVRGGVLALALWLKDGRRGPLAETWVRCLRLGAGAAVALLPSAALFFAGVAIRYAPFVWVAAAAGFVPSLWFVRRAAALDTGAGAPRGKGVPEIGTFLGYAFLVTILAAAMSVLAGGAGRWAAALLLACSAPLHALYLLGWRTHLEQETYPAGGSVAATVTVVGVLSLGAATVYDRYVRETPPVARARSGATFALLGGADSTSETGALSEVDPRDFGFDAGDVVVLSYDPRGDAYSKDDTHRDLRAVAGTMASQLSLLEQPVYVLGHSQAAGILDRMPGGVPGTAVVISPPPKRPPPVEVPPPGVRGPGKPGGDAARVLSGLLDTVGLGGFDVDAPSAPVHLDAPGDPGGARRMAVWALGDSVWLQGDWRRDGEINVVAISDHVGAVNDGRAVSAARRFFAGQPLRSDSASWRGALAAALRYAFEPWRPR